MFLMLARARGVNDGRPRHDVAWRVPNAGESVGFRGLKLTAARVDDARSRGHVERRNRNADNELSHFPGIAWARALVSLFRMSGVFALSRVRIRRLMRFRLNSRRLNRLSRQPGNLLWNNPAGNTRWPNFAVGTLSSSSCGIYPGHPLVFPAALVSARVMYLPPASCS